MATFIHYKAYYGTFWEYYSTPSKAILFFTSITNNVKDVEVLNEPILDWEVSRAGSITFKLPPCNAGYEAIKCKLGHIFIEQNGELIWHGRAITETFDDDLNREIVCEGALNYLLDTHVKPLNVNYMETYQDLFNDFLDCHNRSLSAASSLIFPMVSWVKTETAGSIAINGSIIKFTAPTATGWGLSIWSSPSVWKYKDNIGRRIRISFKATKLGSGSSYLVYGLHLRDDAIAGNGSRLTRIDGPNVSTSKNVSFITYLGTGGLDGSEYEDAYIGFHMYFNGADGDVMQVSDLKVEFYHDYHDMADKTFPTNEGSRRGIYGRIPNRDLGIVKLVDIRDYPTTLDVINSVFINNYGGHLFVSYASTEGSQTLKHPVLNYISGEYEMDTVDDSSPLPEIRAGKNLLSFKETTNWADYPTVIIPLGKQKESWEKVVPANRVTYTSSKYLDKDGYLLDASDSKQCIATLPVREGEIYFIYGEGQNELGLYSIVNSSGDILDHKTFSNNDGDWYSHVQIDIPNGATSLRVAFYNANSAALPPQRSVFIIDKYNFEDLEDYITLDSFIPKDTQGNPMRTDRLNGSKYVPLVDMDHIYTYGWIEKVVHFDDAESQEVLYSMAAWYITMFQKLVKTYEAEAVELAPVIGDANYIPIGMPGSYANLCVPRLNINEPLCVTKVSINLRNFAKNTYSLANLPLPDLADLIAKGLYL